jgi:DNA-binding Xre family transcriptional regulator
MFVYKIDVLQKLKEKGYRSSDIQRNKLLAQKAMQQLRHGEMVGIISLEKICSLLELQPGSIIKWVPDEEVSDGKETTDN